MNKRIYWYIKRLLDIILSFILIIITLPSMLITLILLLCNTGLPIFDIRFPREGYKKKPFSMLKFKTRIYDTKNIWGRKTKLSTIIDNLKLNELPQLFNIFIGQMSFVGPRPFICGEKLPEGKISEKRYMVKPGVTNLAYVYGGKKVSHKQKLDYDEKYYDNFGFKQDFIIMIKTPIEMIRQYRSR